MCAFNVPSQEELRQELTRMVEVKKDVEEMATDTLDLVDQRGQWEKAIHLLYDLRNVSLNLEETAKQQSQKNIALEEEVEEKESQLIKTGKDYLNLKARFEEMEKRASRRAESEVQKQAEQLREISTERDDLTLQLANETSESDALKNARDFGHAVGVHKG